ncbi:helix-turn-helix domain-containing protein [Horticoccus sp. 23ND18S-11]|uniref:helix-turn-helix domain-containing protein n=1 Tax=Horticoccus sp. 23ND18S-11 TaxID=3391832 RepID=UPI0039C9813E
MSTEHQVAEESRRIAIVQAAQAMLAEGRSQSAIAAMLGVTAPSLSRYLKLVKLGGLAALRPETTNAGRRPLARLTADEEKAVQRMALQIDPHDPKKTKQLSVSLALRLYARSPDCRSDLADAILKSRSSKHTLTPTLRRQARVTQSSRLLNAGPEAFNLHGIVTPRDLTFIDFDGSEKPIFPGLLIEGDDMTANEPCWVPWDDSADPCAAKYGVRLVRPQTIFWLDVGSARFVGYSTILRYNDAYRASDLLWSMSHLFHSVGAPRYLRLEYGTWDADLINRLDSVHQFCHIHRATSAKTKFIENRFNQLQKYLALGGVSMGRFRGVKEEENDQWLRCRKGIIDPRPLFPSLETHTARTDAALIAFNSEPVEGEVYGRANAQRFHNRRAWVPDELWSIHTAAHPMKKPTVEESYRLLPVQAEVAVRGGHVAVKSAEHGGIFYFYHDAFARLGDGYKVTVCCDPAQPELGAAVLNRELGARSAVNPSAAVAGRPYGAVDLICVAEAVDRVPQFSATREWDDRESFERRKRYREQCRLQYRAIMPFGRGQTSAAKVAEHRDGRGNVAVAEAGTPRSSGLSALNSQPSTAEVQRPLSPAIAERARREGTRDLVKAAGSTLTGEEIVAACAAEADDTHGESVTAPSMDEIADILRSG